MATQQSKGFSAIAILVALLVIVAAGASGWAVWHKSQKTDSTNKATNNLNQSENDKKKSETAKTDDPSEGGKYLVIKEWDIRIPLDEELRSDVKYGVFTFSSGEQALYLTSVTLASRSVGGMCDIVSRSDSSGQGMSGGVIAISRFEIQPAEVDVSRIFTVGGYYYLIEASNGGQCPGDNGNDRASFSRSLESALKKLETIN